MAVQLQFLEDQLKFSKVENKLKSILKNPFFLLTKIVDTKQSKTKIVDTLRSILSKNHLKLK